jgi:uncharacterized protein (DUF2267 family)
MPITIQPDVIHTLLRAIKNRSKDELRAIDVNHSPAVVLGHLDYLNQQGYLQADFSGDAYADQGPNPLPPTITLQQAQITEKGRTLLAEMDANPPTPKQSSQTTPIQDQDLPFLMKVQADAGLPDLYDARDLTVVVYRCMRDLLPTATIERVQEELGVTETLPSADPALQRQIAELWRDTNPLVAWLSRLRPPFNTSGPLGMTDQRFLQRIELEGSLPRGVTAETLATAVFAATKRELSDDTVQMLGTVLPGRVQELWHKA